MNSLATNRGILTLALSAAIALGACGGQAMTTTQGPGGGRPSQDTSGPTQDDAQILLHDVVLEEWSIDASSNFEPVTGRLLLNGEGVAGATVKVDDYTLTEGTAPDGSFTYPADITVPHRYIVEVADASNAEVAGEAVSDQGRVTLERTSSGFNVAYGVRDLKLQRRKDSIRVTGQLTGGNNASLTPTLFAFSLSGRVTDSVGEPVSDVWVSFRPVDRQTWTLDATDIDGRFHSFFFPSTESTEAGPYSVIVSRGDQSWEVKGGVMFERLRSATIDIRMPRSHHQPLIAPVSADAESGAYYETVLVGLAVGNKVLSPRSATWLDQHGRFSLDLPADKAPRIASIWVSRQYVFVDGARPGGDMDLSALPMWLGPHVPREIVDVRIPSPDRGSE
jgi:hypothetical protein